MNNGTGLYITINDFALTTHEVEPGEIAESGPGVRRIGLTPPWEDRRAWRNMVRAALGDVSPVRIPVERLRVARPQAA